MDKITLQRLNKDSYYGNIALQIAQRSTCLRRKYGAIIVNDDRIVSTGYNGAPRGTLNCNDIGMCLREMMKIPHGERYELCRSVHAEANAIINASPVEMNGATLYLAGWDVVVNEDGSVNKFNQLRKVESCAMCKRMIINAGIGFVVYFSTYPDIINVQDWVEHDTSLCLPESTPEYKQAVESAIDFYEYGKTKYEDL